MYCCCVRSVGGICGGVVGLLFGGVGCFRIVVFIWWWVCYGRIVFVVCCFVWY